MATSRLYEEYDALTELKKEAEKDLLAEAVKQPITKILTTAPGLGPITRGLNRNHNSTLKNIFKGAATTVIMNLPHDPLHELQRGERRVARG